MEPRPAGTMMGCRCSWEASAVSAKCCPSCQYARRPTMASKLLPMSKKMMIWRRRARRSSLLIADLTPLENYFTSMPYRKGTFLTRLAGDDNDLDLVGVFWDHSHMPGLGFDITWRLQDALLFKQELVLLLQACLLCGKLLKAQPGLACHPHLVEIEQSQHADEYDCD